MILEYLAQDALARARILTSPVSTGHASVSLGLEEHASFSTQAAWACEQMVDLAPVVLGCELVAAVRALRMDPGRLPDAARCARSTTWRPAALGEDRADRPFDDDLAGRGTARGAGLPTHPVVSGPMRERAPKLPGGSEALLDEAYGGREVVGEGTVGPVLVQHRGGGVVHRPEGAVRGDPRGSVRSARTAATSSHARTSGARSTSCSLAHAACIKKLAGSSRPREIDTCPVERGW